MLRGELGGGRDDGGLEVEGIVEIDDQRIVRGGAGLFLPVPGIEKFFFLRKLGGGVLEFDCKGFVDRD